MGKVLNVQEAKKRLQPKENGLPAGPSPVSFLPQRVIPSPPILGMFPTPQIEGAFCEVKPHLWLVD